MQGDYKETALNYIVSDKTATFYTAEGKWIRKIQQWAEQYPYGIKITTQNFEDGKLDSIICELPVNWFKVSPPSKRNLTPEQRLAARDRLLKAREMKRN
jgi:hypothetical protein